MDKPLVSIITPCYNHEKYLDDYFKSILNQTYDNIELIIIDDASKDGSKKVIRSYENELKNRFVNFKFIDHKKNIGLVKNCNLGLELSKGKYIAIFASDDIMLKNRIEINVEFLENNDYGMAYSDGYKVKENFSYCDINNFDNKFLDFLVKEKNQCTGFVADKLLENNFIPAPTVMLKREVFDKVGTYDERLSFEDYEMWLRIAEKYKIGFINEPLVFYRQSDYSMTGLLNKQQKYKNLISFKKTIEKHIESSTYEYNDIAKKKAKLNLYRQMIGYGFIYEERNLLNKYFIKLVRLNGICKVFNDYKEYIKFISIKIPFLYRYIIKKRYNKIYKIL